MDGIAWLIGLLTAAVILFLIAVRRRDRSRHTEIPNGAPAGDVPAASFLDDGSTGHHDFHALDGHGHSDGDGGAGHGGDGGGGHH